MSPQQYICFPFYRCTCPPGMRVSLATARRHQIAAQYRLRLEQSNPTLCLPSPSPAIASLDFFSIDLPPTPGSSTGNEADNSINPVSDAIPHHVANDSDSDRCEGVDIDPHNDRIIESSRNSSESSSQKQGSSGLSVDDRLAEEDTKQSSPASDLNPDMGSDMENIDYVAHDPMEEYIEDIFSDDGRLHGWHSPELKSFMSENAWHLGFYFRHSVTLDAMDDLYRRDKGADAECFKTIRNRIIQHSGIRLTQFRYCSRIHELLSYDEETGIVSACSHPHCSISPSPVKDLRYISLWERILVRLQSPSQGPEIVTHVKESYKRQLDNGFGEYEDFYSGSCFREYSESLEQFPGSTQTIPETSLPVIHLFLLLSTDGAPAFKSATKSFWPVVLLLGNIPPHSRYQNQNVFPVLCIPGNPGNLESFLEPLFAEIEQLNEGVKCTLWDGSCAIIKCHLMYALADLQAMKKLCCIKGVNGICPCRFCLIEGSRAGPRRPLYYPDHAMVRKRSRSGRIQLVKRKYWSAHHLPLRNEEGLKQLFEQLDDLHSHSNTVELEDLRKRTGIIREPEICRRFSSIRPFASMPIDLMHLLFENVAPLIVKIWLGILDTDGEHAYLKSATVCQKVDAILESSGSGIIDSIRRPRGLKIQGLWKAEEWRTFVLVTSLVALQNFLPRRILDGWWQFCQICDLSMRPYLNDDDLEQLSILCLSFFEHYSAVYYGGKADRIHLMRYVVHLILHIPMSTMQCGPLVCLSQFATERFIGITKSTNMAKHLYAESVFVKWSFQHALMMCETMSGVSVPLQRSGRDIRVLDIRSSASNQTSYLGYWLRGPRNLTRISELETQFCVDVCARLARFYKVDMSMSTTSSFQFLENNSEISCWARLVVQKECELAPRKYGKCDVAKRERSNAYVAAEFRYDEDPANKTRVYYGKVLTFLEHTFENPLTSLAETRILALVSWVTGGLRVGHQGQIYAIGGNESAIFSSTTIEDVGCIVRNISVFQARNHSITSRKAFRTFFVDEHLSIDHLLSDQCREEEGNKRLFGVQ